MSKEFNEAFVSDDVDPHNPNQVADFEWDTLYERLGESVGADLNGPDLPAMSTALAVILDWILRVDLRKKNCLKAIGLRTVAMAWVVDPSRFHDESVRTISKRLGFTAPVMSVLSADFSRRFKIQNRFQDHDWRKQ
jgi:hypothetical protein